MRGVAECPGQHAPRRAIARTDGPGLLLPDLLVPASCLPAARGHAALGGLGATFERVGIPVGRLSVNFNANTEQLTLKHSLGPGEGALT